MSNNKLAYGMLSTYEYTCFFAISNPIAFDARIPVTLYQAIAYLLYLSDIGSGQLLRLQSLMNQITKSLLK
jgi:hypothetical protein